ncbi:MAG: ribosome biogenesis GTP-binding protein YihA/YsxC [Mucinivorans sp.]
MNEINKARFLCSSEKLSQCPPAVLDGKMVAELAFIGRSNVGKSSLINCLTANSSLAKVSGTPGKTKLINHFVVDEGWLLVDLPGYGYAKASKTMREAFSALITAYITKREELYCLFVLIDIRLEPQKIDREFMEMLASNGVPFVLVFTKADKLSAAQRARAIQAYKKALEDDWEDFPEYFITSAANSLGREELLQYIFNLVDTFEEPAE